MLRRPLPTIALALCALTLACKDGGPAASTVDGDDTGVETTTGSMDPTGGASETGGAASHEICERYLACVAATDPTGLPAAEQGFGSDSECWTMDQSRVDMCLDICEGSLLAAHAVYPEEPACYQCEDDTDCDRAADEHCLKGVCGVGQCGDGLVQDGELCDGQDGCSSDCLGGATCSPLTSVGCAANEYCLYGGSPGNPLYTTCKDFNPYACEDVDCPRGSYATSGEEAACNCLPFCDVNAPEPCPEGSTCVAVHSPPNVQLVETALHYLGKCQ